MAGGDWSRANRSAALADPGALAIVWRRRVNSGVSCNLLVDPQGRVFAAGAGHVTELGFDGRVAYRKTAEFSECLSAALLADGSRVVLGAEGRLSAWSPRGAVRFDRPLDAPARFSHSSLLPLPDGGLLASLGSRLVDVGPDGEPRSNAQLAQEVVESLIVGGRVLVVDTLGQVSEWHGRSAPRRLGSFGTGVVAVAVSDASTLVGIASRGALAFSLERGDAKPLLAFDRTGVLPSISIPIPGHPIFLRSDGVVEHARDAAPLGLSPRGTAGHEPLRDAQLIASADGGAVWIAANLPFEVVALDQSRRTLADVVCAQPVSLVPALPGHFLLACKTGQLWLIGPTARAADPAIRLD